MLKKTKKGHAGRAGGHAGPEEQRAADAEGICFSKRTSHYDLNTESTTWEDDGVILCLKAIMTSKEFTECDSDDLEREGTNYPAYKVEWSRFGNINIYKYNHGTNEWILQ